MGRWPGRSTWRRLRPRHSRRRTAPAWARSAPPGCWPAHPRGAASPPPARPPCWQQNTILFRHVITDGCLEVASATREWIVAAIASSLSANAPCLAWQERHVLHNGSLPSLFIMKQQSHGWPHYRDTGSVLTLAWGAPDDHKRLRRCAQLRGQLVAHCQLRCRCCRRPTQRRNCARLPCHAEMKTSSYARQACFLHRPLPGPR